MASGAAISLQTLIGLRSQCGRIQPAQQSRTFSALAGGSRAHYRGRGIDFEEVRHYQPGDEPRAIDWRITARSGQAHTKLYREERERPILLLVDQRSTMRFGSQRCFKSVQAAEVAALLGWAAMANHDRVGALVFGDHQHRDCRPSARRNGLLQLLTIIARYNAALLNKETAVEKPQADTADLMNQGDGLNHSIAELRQLSRPGMAIFIISDFIGLSAESYNTLALLRRHCDITAIQVYDPMEEQLPSLRNAWYSNGAQQIKLMDSTGLKQRFSHSVQLRQQELVQQLANRGIALLRCSTRDDARSVLERSFAKRGKAALSRPRKPANAL